MANPQVDIIKLSEKTISNTLDSVETSKKMIEYAYGPHELSGHGDWIKVMNTARQTEALDLVLDQLDQNIHYIQEKHKESLLNLYKDHVNNINTLIQYTVENERKVRDYLSKGACDNGHCNIDLQIILKSVESMKYLRFIEERIKKEKPHRLLKKISPACFVSQDMEKNAWL